MSSTARTRPTSAPIGPKAATPPEPSGTSTTTRCASSARRRAVYLHAESARRENLLLGLGHDRFARIEPRLSRGRELVHQRRLPLCGAGPGRPQTADLQNLAGERTLLDEVDCNPPLTADIDLYVCFEPQQFFAYVGNVTNPAWIVDPIEVEGGYWAGVENGCVYPIRFERFKVSEHFATNQRCPKCSCYCDTNAVPKLLTLTIVKTKAGWLSDWLDTKTVQLAFNPTYGFWVGELLPTPLDIPDCPPGETSELTFCLQCPSKLPDPTLADDFSLTVCCTFRYPAPNCDINRFRATHTSTKSSTCEPLFFYFGPKDSRLLLRERLAGVRRGDPVRGQREPMTTSTDPPATPDAPGDRPARATGCVCADPGGKRFVCAAPGGKNAHALESLPTQSGLLAGVGRGSGTAPAERRPPRPARPVISIRHEWARRIDAARQRLAATLSLRSPDDVERILDVCEQRGLWPCGCGDVAQQWIRKVLDPDQWDANWGDGPATAQPDGGTAIGAPSATDGSTADSTAGAVAEPISPAEIERRKSVCRACPEVRLHVVQFYRAGPGPRGRQSRVCGRDPLRPAAALRPHGNLPAVGERRLNRAAVFSRLQPGCRKSCDTPGTAPAWADRRTAAAGTARGARRRDWRLAT